MEVTPDTPTLTSVKKGDEILPDAEKVFRAAMINQSNKAMSISDKADQSKQLSRDIRDLKNGVIKAINQLPGKIPQTNVVIENPLKRWVKTGNSTQGHI